MSLTSGLRPEHGPGLAESESTMLKGTRDGILKRIQPISVHGQVSWDVYFNDIDNPDGQATVARIGPEAVGDHNMVPGDRIQLEYVVGVVVRVSRVKN